MLLLLLLLMMMFRPACVSGLSVCPLSLFSSPGTSSGGGCDVSE